MDENQDGYVDFEEMKRAIMEELHFVLHVGFSSLYDHLHRCGLVLIVICCKAWRKGAYNEVQYS